MDSSTTARMRLTRRIPDTRGINFIVVVVVVVGVCFSFIMRHESMTDSKFTDTGDTRDRDNRPRDVRAFHLTLTPPLGSIDRLVWPATTTRRSRAHDHPSPDSFAASG